MMALRNITMPTRSSLSKFEGTPTRVLFEVSAARLGELKWPDGDPGLIDLPIYGNDHFFCYPADDPEST